MDRTVFNNAKDRYRRAKGHLIAFSKASPDNGDAEREWELFLTEITRAFNRLMAGERKGHPSEAITKQIRRDRKTDPMLSYLRESRNALEHTIEQVSTVTGSPRPLRENEDAPHFGVEVEYEDGRRETFEMERSNVFVLENMRLTLRSFKVGGKRYDPPTTHLGLPLADSDPLTIGDVALQYFERMAEEIERVSKG